MFYEDIIQDYEFETYINEFGETFTILKDKDYE